MKRLRLKLVGVLILVALLPALPAALTVRALLRHSLDPLLETRIEEGARAGMASTRELLDAEITAFEATIASGNADTLRAEALGAHDRASLEALPRTVGTYRVAPQRIQLMGADHLVAARADRARLVWFSRPVPSDLISRAARITDGLTLVKALQHERGTVYGSLLSTFLVVYGVILVGVLLFGLVVGSRVTRPIGALAEGIGAVAAGDLDTHVEHSGGGAIGHLIAQFNGMVERLRTQQRDLVRLEKLAAWRQMARRLAHEVKNPLTPIQLAAQEMRDAYEGTDASYRELLAEGTGIIEEEVASLRTLVSSFSQFSRMPDPVLADVAASELAEDVALLYGARVHVESDEGTCHVDRDQIHRAIVNLVNNALDAQGDAAANVPVDVGLELPNGQLVITVADRGPGVPGHLAGEIFEPDMTTKSDGMGLGLAIVKQTVDGHGGTIAVDARPGGGASFRIELPAGTRSTSP